MGDGEHEEALPDEDLLPEPPEPGAPPVTAEISRGDRAAMLSPLAVTGELSRGPPPPRPMAGPLLPPPPIGVSPLAATGEIARGGVPSSTMLLEPAAPGVRITTSPMAHTGEIGTTMVFDPPDDDDEPPQPEGITSVDLAPLRHSAPPAARISVAPPAFPSPPPNAFGSFGAPAGATSPRAPAPQPESVGPWSRRDERARGERPSTRPSSRRDEWASRSEKPSRDALAGRVLGGKYQLIRLLGQGGMGAVYRGEHLTLGVPIAVKTMHRHYASMPDYVRRFRREAHASSLLSHQNVVRVLDFGQEDEVLYLVMEFLDGRTLSAWLDSLPGLPPLADVEGILLDLLAAFELAHSFGIVHRDLKPDNIFLTELNGRRVTKVVDFGLAHVDDAGDAGPTLTKDDIVAGTPAYMSPEQCRSLAVGPSADLYAMGCVMTTMLQGRPPFQGDSPVETISKHLFLPPPPLERPPEAEQVPQLLERLRLDLLAKQKERRPADAAAVRERLLEAMSNEASALRMPARKSAEGYGDRDSRAPSWERPSRVSAPPPGASSPGPLPVDPLARTAVPEVEGTRRVGLVRLGPPSPQGLSQLCATGLAAQGILTKEVTDPAAVAKAGFEVVVIDAGSDGEGARSWLARLAQAAPRARIVVCAADLTTERMTALVSAGAADVLRYPVGPDTLGKKIERVLRRKR